MTLSMGVNKGTVPSHLGQVASVVSGKMELTHVRFFADTRQLTQNYGSILPCFGIEYPDSKRHNDQM